MANSAVKAHKHSDKWSKGKANKGGAHVRTKHGHKFVVFCPECPTIHLGGRQLGAIAISPGTRTVKCKEKHVIRITGSFYHTK